MSCRETYVRVQGGGQATQQRDGRLRCALFDALDLIDSHFNPPGRLEDAVTEAAALVIHGLAEGQGITDGDLLRILGLLRRARRVW